MKPNTVNCLARTLLASVALGCGGDINMTTPGLPLAPGESYAANATVRLVPAVEGPCWALDMPRGRYQPFGLPAGFQRDGLAVYAIVSGQPDALSICYVAPIVKLDSIRQR